MHHSSYWYYYCAVFYYCRKIKPASQEIAWFKSTTLPFLYHIKEKCGFLYVNLQCTSQRLLKQMEKCNNITSWALKTLRTWKLFKYNYVTKRRKQILIFPWCWTLYHWPSRFWPIWKIMPIWKDIQNKLSISALSSKSPGFKRISLEQYKSQDVAGIYYQSLIMNYAVIQL